MARRTKPFSERYNGVYRCYRTEDPSVNWENSSSSSIVNSFLPKANKPKKNFSNKKRKREQAFDDEEMKEVEINECPICSWEFPKFFGEVERNQHINACCEGRGKEDKEERLKTMQCVIEMDKERLIEEGKMCPICLKEMSGRKLKNHIKKCQK